MNVVWVIVGAAVGVVVAGFPGFLVGLILGWLLVDRFRIHQQLNRLESELARVRVRPAGEDLMAEGAAAPQKPAATSPPPARAAYKPEEVTGHITPQPFEDEQIDREFLSGPQRRFSDRPLLPRLPEVISGFFTGGNLLVKTGVVILFFGVSFLVKYAAQRGFFPVEVRLAGSALGGLVLLAVGWRLRRKRLEYALALQGGGIGVLYIVVFAAFRLYSLLPPAVAFALLVAISIACGAFAVLEETPTLALFGISGGFLAPLLASTGHGSHVFLFGYYAVLNAGIIGIAWFKSWRPLNLAGFLFTFVIGAGWGARYYRPEYFPTTEPFLVLFFLMYVAVAVLFALRQPPLLKGYLDGTLIFGTPVVSFALQATLVEHYRYGLAWSALCAGLIYAVLAFVLFRRDLPLRPLAEAFAAFGTVYLTLAVPLAFDGRWTAAIWAVEGAAVAWTGMRQARQVPRVFGIFLQFAAGLAFAVAGGGEPEGAVPILNAFYLGCLLLAAAGLWSGYTLYRYRESVAQWEKPLTCVLLAWGLVWWLAGGFHEMVRHLEADLLYGAVILLVAATCAACHFVEVRINWRPLVFPALGIVPALWLLLGGRVDSHPFADGGWFAWPVAVAVLYLVLYLRDGEALRVLPFLHAAALWLLAVLGTWELGWQVVERLLHVGSWLVVACVILPDLILLVLGWGGRLLAWPVQRRERDYLSLGAGPLAVWSLLWIFSASVGSSGDPFPFPWVPFANVLDAAVIFSLAALVLWYRKFCEVSGGHPRVVEELPGGSAAPPVLFGAAVFLWLDSVLARALHYWGGVGLAPRELFESTLAQTTYAVFWAVLSLCVMVFSSRRQMRRFWFCGGALLAVVVLKLFLIDLAGQGTVERIVSFVAVGVLLLVIGWVSPVPPQQEGNG